MLKTTEEHTIEFAQVSWTLQMDALTLALRDRGHEIPSGYRVNLVSVPEEERDENGLPLFKVVTVAVF